MLCLSSWGFDICLLPKICQTILWHYQLIVLKIVWDPWVQWSLWRHSSIWHLYWDNAVKTLIDKQALKSDETWAPYVYSFIAEVFKCNIEWIAFLWEYIVLYMSMFVCSAIWWRKLCFYYLGKWHKCNERGQYIVVQIIAMI